ncbi:MAG TPA: hypothetical protein VFE98_11445 [Candidatus Bathyarchaeia archaeon]|nr:hypothetical protein [Candidatus Bathyarchaeia archaeon]
MNEDIVVDHTEQWLTKLPNVTSVQRNQIIMTGGLEADLVGYNSAGDGVYVVECKGSVGLNGVAQGLGQVYQYAYQKSLSRKWQVADVLFVLPEDIANILDRLKIPDKVKVYLVSPSGQISERIRRRGVKPTIELQLPNTFYIRDCEINHFKDILTIIDELSRARTGSIADVEIRKEIHQRHPKIAASGYNHLITIRSLGILGGHNRLTPKGYQIFGLLEKGDEPFYREFSDMFYCFLVNVMNAVLLIANDKKTSLQSIKCTDKDIAKKICDTWNATVRFMYDPRTVSTAKRILKELGALDYTTSSVTLKKLVHPTYLPLK